MPSLPQGFLETLGAAATFFATTFSTGFFAAALLVPCALAFTGAFFDLPLSAFAFALVTFFFAMVVPLTSSSACFAD